MNIALMSHDNKKELMVQFCTAYAGILSHHNIYATNTTGHMVADATGLNVHCFLSYAHGGSQQIGARIAMKKSAPKALKSNTLNYNNGPVQWERQLVVCLRGIKFSLIFSLNSLMLGDKT